MWWWAMTPDNILIPWIAKKLGVEIKQIEATGETWWLKNSKEVQKWGNKGVFGPFTGDWMLKGMAIAEKSHIFTQINNHRIYMNDLTIPRDASIEVVGRELNIPHAFWECWYAVEKGEPAPC